jgi:hypothetical protein
LNQRPHPDRKGPAWVGRWQPAWVEVDVRRVWGRRRSGSRGQGDGVAEGLELADVGAGLAVGVDAAGVVVGAQVVEAGGGSASRCQTITRMDRAMATRALSLPMRRTRRR